MLLCSLSPLVALTTFIYVTSFGAIFAVTAGDTMCFIQQHVSAINSHDILGTLPLELPPPPTLPPELSPPPTIMHSPPQKPSTMPPQHMPLPKKLSTVPKATKLIPPPLSSMNPQSKRFSTVPQPGMLPVEMAPPPTMFPLPSLEPPPRNLEGQDQGPEQNNHKSGQNDHKSEQNEHKSEQHGQNSPQKIDSAQGLSRLGGPQDSWRPLADYMQEEKYKLQAKIDGLNNKKLALSHAIRANTLQLHKEIDRFKNLAKSEPTKSNSSCVDNAQGLRERRDFLRKNLRQLTAEVDQIEREGPKGIAQKLGPT